jgi:hypothetical protein
MNFLKTYWSDLVLFAHPTFGVLGTMGALWVLAEALNPSEASARRIKCASWFVAICMSMAWILGGYWYVTFYAADKAIIVKGPWPFAHNLFMETKEHLFFIAGMLALYLPIVAARPLARDGAARKMVIAVAALIILNGLALEGGGAVVNHGAKMAAVQLAGQGAE